MIRNLLLRMGLTGDRRPAPPRPAGILTIAFAAVRESRPAVQAIFLLRFLVGVVAAGEPANQRFGLVAAGAATWLAATFAIYLFGGAMDVVEDRANRSQRPIAAGILAPNHAVRIAGFSAVLALACGAYLGVQMLALVAVFLSLGHQYEAPPLALKKRPAATAISGILAGALTYLAGVVVVDGRLGSQFIVFVAAMSAWMGLVGVSAKDLSDVVGDREAGRMTISTRFGETVGGIVTAILAVAVSTAFLIAAWLAAPSLVVPAVVLGVFAAVVVRYGLARPLGHTRSERRRAYRAFMTAQYAGNGAMLLVLW